MRKYQKIIVGIIIAIVICLGITLTTNANTNEFPVNSNTKIIDTFGTETVATYSHSQDGISIYTDSTNNTEYLIYEDKVIGFIKENTNNILLKNLTSMSEKKALNIAEQFIMKQVSDFEDYDLSYSNYVEYSNTCKEYQFSFIKKLANYNTTDLIYITVDTSGNVTSFLTKDRGKFDSYANISINNNAIEKFIYEQLTKKYSENLKEYRELDRTFKKENNLLVLECSIVVITNDETEILELIQYQI